MNRHQNLNCTNQCIYLQNENSLLRNLYKICIYHFLFYSIQHILKIFQDMTNRFYDLQFFLLRYLINLQLQPALHQVLQLNHHHIQLKLYCKILLLFFYLPKIHQEKSCAYFCQFYCSVT
ncbi:hypothetical protein MnTg01_00360 [archaeon MnTg01]|nr:hypothetical protein MnTg01_00360 [archaeon MnTg01]